MINRTPKHWEAKNAQWDAMAITGAGLPPGRRAEASHPLPGLRAGRLQKGRAGSKESKEPHRGVVTTQKFGRSHSAFSLELNFLQSQRSRFCRDHEVRRIGVTRVRHAGAKD